MSKKSHSLGHHDWHSQDYVLQWAEHQDEGEGDRRASFQLMAETIPYDKQAPIRILDLGAGYGALTQILLNHFSKATAVCQDGSEEMAKLGRERLDDLKGRFTYILCDFSKQGWSRMVKGSFEAVVSSIAIHNVRSPQIIQGIYKETFPLVKTGGCFLNFDRMTPPLEDQMRWLREVGFEDVNCFWENNRLALFGGFKRE